MPLDPHTHGQPTYHKAQETPSPRYTQLGQTTFVSPRIPLHEDITPDINNWLHRDAPSRNQARLDHFSQKYPQAHKLITEKWNYQGGSLGPEERGMQCPIEAHKGDKNLGLGFGIPTTGGTNTDGHAFSNIHRDLVDITHHPSRSTSLGALR